MIFKRHWSRWLLVIPAALLIWYIFCLPGDLFKGASYSTVAVDRNGELLGARISTDGEWRFSVPGSEPGLHRHRQDSRSQKETGNGRQKYLRAVVEFEDRWFRWHPGVNPVSICKAFIANMKAGHTTRGGSTLTMQVIRMSRKRERTVRQKLIEAVLATRLELRCSKDEILELYAANAPFGGNVVGLDAAAWRYFGRPATELSWGEAATLAVLPNSPSSIRLEKNREKLLAKRNRLLGKLKDRGYITEEDFEASCSEPLPSEPLPLPSYTSHLIDGFTQCCQGKGKFFSAVLDHTPEDRDISAGSYIRTSIDIDLQRRVEEILRRRSGELAQEGIADMAAVVIDVSSGEVLAYCGNAAPERRRQGGNVDVARSPRSSGSILKPFLYCDAIGDGTILPYSLIADTPVNINGFAPQNYDMTYEGAVPAAEALSRSLNVPSVHLLKDFGVQKFQEDLKERGLTTLTRSASDYGLSLILGGGECRLDEVTAAYAGMAAEYMKDAEVQHDDKTAIYYTFDALKDVNRPDEIDWHLIRSVKKIAWKTGTSYGYRDAWAVGVTPGYAVGVWAGNASGAGAPGLLGARTAGPVMFEIFNLLPAGSASWFAAPVLSSGTRYLETCKASGWLAGPYCTEKDTLLLPSASLEAMACPYHHLENGQSVFRLAPAMEWFYRQRHPEYDAAAGNERNGSTPIMEFIYPENGSRITLPTQLDGSPGAIVLNLAHHDRNSTVYWHLDQEYLGETRFIHQMRISPEPGWHSITAVDDAGHQVSLRIEIS